MPKVKCPICGKELAIGLGEEYVGLVVGPELDLRMLSDDQATYAHSPCGWVIVRKKAEIDLRLDQVKLLKDRASREVD